MDIIKASMPQRAMRDGHPARRSFQAICIEVNGELDVLQQALHDAFDCLKKPRRSVGNYYLSFLRGSNGEERFCPVEQGLHLPQEFPVCVCGI